MMKASPLILPSSGRLTNWTPSLRPGIPERRRRGGFAATHATGRLLMVPAYYEGAQVLWGAAKHRDTANGKRRAGETHRPRPAARR